MGRDWPVMPTIRELLTTRARIGTYPVESIPHRTVTDSRTPQTLAGCISGSIRSYLTHERSTCPVSKAKASGWEIGSTFCSRGPDRQLAQSPLAGDSSQRKGEGSVCRQVTALRHASRLLRKFPW